MTNAEQKAPFLLHFRRFLRAHEYSLTLLGAVLVFATFVVKEAFRDHYKDIDDSVSAARTAFLMHQDYFSIDSALLGVRVDELITRGFIQKEKNPYLAAVNSPHLVDDIQSNLTRLSNLLDNGFQRRSEKIDAPTYKDQASADLLAFIQVSATDKHTLLQVSGISTSWAALSHINRVFAESNSVKFVLLVIVFECSRHPRVRANSFVPFLYRCFGKGAFLAR